jgi:hypothetical protein
MTTKHDVIAVEPVESLIRVIRGQRVILDSDLARVYGVTTKKLNQAVKRNRQRFPSDFAFQLTPEEVANLRSQIVTSSSSANSSRSQVATASYGGRRYLPYAFTEYGAFQAANVLNSDRAVQMGVFVVRAFVKMREALIANRELAEKLAELEHTLVARLDLHDSLIAGIIKELHKLANPPVPPRKQIGFHVRERQAVYRTKRKS